MAQQNSKKTARFAESLANARSKGVTNLQAATMGFEKGIKAVVENKVTDTAKVVLDTIFNTQFQSPFKSKDRKKSLQYILRQLDEEFANYLSAMIGTDSQFKKLHRNLRETERLLTSQSPTLDGLSEEKQGVAYMVGVLASAFCNIARYSQCPISIQRATATVAKVGFNILALSHHTEYVVTACSLSPHLAACFFIYYVRNTAAEVEIDLKVKLLRTIVTHAMNWKTLSDHQAKLLLTLGLEEAAIAEEEERQDDWAKKFQNSGTIRTGNLQTLDHFLLKISAKLEERAESKGMSKDAQEAISSLLQNFLKVDVESNEEIKELLSCIRLLDRKLAGDGVLVTLLTEIVSRRIVHGNK